MEIDWNAAREADTMCLSKKDLVIIGGGGLVASQRQADSIAASVLPICDVCVLGIRF